MFQVMGTKFSVTALRLGLSTGRVLLARTTKSMVRNHIRRVGALDHPRFSKVLRLC